jgi:transcriptional regulator with XRE-family HTH domain
MDNSTDQAMLRIRELFEKSGLTLDDLGQRMGYSGGVARKSAWQFLHKTCDPRLSMLRKFAQAVGVPVAALLAEEKKKGRSE